MTQILSSLSGTTNVHPALLMPMKKVTDHKCYELLPMKKLRTTNVNAYAYEKLGPQNCYLLRPKKKLWTTNVNCLYAYEKVMDHKCYLFMPLKELETIKIHFLIINLLQMFIAYAY